MNHDVPPSTEEPRGSREPASAQTDAAAARVSASPATQVSSSASSASTSSGSNGGRGERVVLDDRAIRRALTRIAHEIVERHEELDDLYLVAIPNGGVPLGRMLRSNLEQLAGFSPPCGILDTTLYRDDLATSGERPLLRVTEMPSSVDGRVVVIVEDVVSTGRTIRAAMDALMDFGRPQMVQVVALVDRGHRELPIKIDYVGKNIPTAPGEKVKFRSQGGGTELVEPFEVVVATSKSEEPVGLQSRQGGGL